MLSVCKERLKMGELLMFKRYSLKLAQRGDEASHDESTADGQESLGT